MRIVLAFAVVAAGCTAADRHVASFQTTASRAALLAATADVLDRPLTPVELERAVITTEHVKTPTAIFFPVYRSVWHRIRIGEHRLTIESFCKPDVAAKGCDALPKDLVEAQTQLGGAIVDRAE